jgi:hypothetical protein
MDSGLVTIFAIMTLLVSATQGFNAGWGFARRRLVNLNLFASIVCCGTWRPVFEIFNRHFSQSQVHYQLYRCLTFGWMYLIFGISVWCGLRVYDSVIKR